MLYVPWRVNTLLKSLVNRFINWFRRPVVGVVIRRYQITTGYVGELYLHGVMVGDTLDTFTQDTQVITTRCVSTPFTDYLKSDSISVGPRSSLGGQHVVFDVTNSFAVDISPTR